MKELSIEEKAKAYDEAKLRMSAAYNSNRCSIDFMNEIFPELKESEDEKIRKAIIDVLKAVYECADISFISQKQTLDSYVSYLEKQGEHAKFRDSIQVGDKVTRNQDGVLVNLSQLNRVAKKYEKQDEQKQPKELTNSEFVEKCKGLSRLEQHILALVPTRPIDAIKVDARTIRYLVEQEQGEQKPNPCENCDIATNNCQNFPCIIRDGEQKPADKVEPKFKVGDTIIAKDWTSVIKEPFYIDKIEDGYYWDGENTILVCNQEEFEIFEQKPAWCEEDNTFFKAIIRDIENIQYISEDAKKDRINWFKSLKERVQQSKQEWSEEDEEIHRKCICAMRASACGFPEEEKFVEQVDNWLKSLKDRVQLQNLTVTDKELVQAKKDAYNDALDKIEYHSGEPTFDDGWNAAIWYLKKRNAQPKNTWRPSDEQIGVIEAVINNRSFQRRHLDSLYADLKKLREE